MCLWIILGITGPGLGNVGECGDILTIPGEKDGGNIKISCRYPVENHRSSCGKR